MPGRWPNAFIAGTPKAGTTSLYRYLAQHPAIHMSEEKEPHFFDDVFRDTDPDTEARRQATEAYLALFADAEEPIVGEATPGYFSKPGVFERIDERCTDPRFVVSLRDPIAAIHSGYLMRARRGKQRIEDEPEGFTEHVRTSLAADPGSRDRYNIEGRFYGTHYERFCSVFEEDRIHLLTLDELGEDPRGVLRDIARFLDVDPGAVDAIDLDTRHNPFGVPSNELFRWLLTSDLPRRVARLVLPEPVRVWLGEHALLEKTEKPPMGEEPVELLADEFEPEITKLEKQTGRSFDSLRASWS
ncbi:hypothetical protein BRD56_09805 [Thermoplasmatales archaeon SW_10_69_26]|nr:MAG: hypothetical protein BRD56_09805 [Thermoplasmatales archaeon SW_10_69_26]